MTMPVQKPGRSKQDYRTPPEFLAALKKKLGITHFVADLAATEENAVAASFYTEADDALTRGWSLGGWVFCNPPYKHIEPWVIKAVEESEKGAQIAMLLPAGVGSNWWDCFVHNWAHVLFLNGRLTFVGEKDCYPKDSAILLYSHYIHGGYETWTWRDE